METSAKQFGGEGHGQERAAWNERFVAVCRQKLCTPTNAEEGIRQLLAFLGENLRCHRVYVFEEVDHVKLSNTYEWCARGVTSGIRQLPYIAKKDLHPWYRQLSGGKTVVERDVMILRQQEGMIGDILNRQQIRTIVLSPMVAGGTLQGLLGADNPPPDRMEQIADLFDALAGPVQDHLCHRDPVLGLHQ